VCAKSFLYHQVRNFAGSLKLVGEGRWSVDDFKLALNAVDRCQGGPTAPPEGLYFVKVVY
jgi:tRNA pseudouridine38-40 synthase